MDLPEELTVAPVTVMTTVTVLSLTVTAIVVLYRFIRPIFSVRVNCWFCSQDSTVPYGNRNCWDCPHCDQYNGFSQDGGYNKPIPAQHIEDINHSPTARENQVVHNTSDSSETSQLCHTCNQNQLLKVKQMANFVPYNEENFEIEAESFRQHLEKIYRLCRACERRVNATLAQQNAILRHKLEECRVENRHNDSSVLNSSVDSTCSEHLLCQMATPVHLHILRLGSVLSAVTLFIVSVHRLLEDSATDQKLSLYLPQKLLLYIVFLSETTLSITVLGLLSTYVGIFLCGKDRLCLSDALSAFCWLGVLLLESSALSHTLSKEDRFLLEMIITLISTAACVASFLARRNVRSNKIRVRKKMRNLANLSGMSSLSEASSVEDSPVRSLSRNAINQQAHGVSSNQAATHSVSSNQASTHSVSSNQAATHSVSNMMNISQQQEPRQEEHSEHPIYSHIHKMSLGPPSAIRNRPRGMFADMANLSPGPSHLDTYSASPRQRPLISPARFTFRNKPSHQISTPSIAKSLFTSHHVPAESVNEDGAVCDSYEDDSSSNQSSVCPVGSSVNERDVKAQSGAVSWRIIIFRCLIGVSIGLNFVLFAYLMNITAWFS